jgi:LPS export ABC transporter protein LptC
MLMVRRMIVGAVVFVVAYVALIQIQMWMSGDLNRASKAGKAKELKHRVYSFSFAKYSDDGKKEIEIEGDSADILSRTVNLMNVVAKAYAEETPVTITADEGTYDKSHNKVHLQKNVVATTENGTRLMSEALDIMPTKKVMETDVHAEVKKDNIRVEGIGARGDSQLKKVKFGKKVTVVIKDLKAENAAEGPTVITSDGPLVVDYAKNIAHFEKNVTAQDARGTLKSDTMDVYYNRHTRRVSKMVATGNVVIENPDGNQTFSDSVIYLADEGRIILGGDTEALYYDGDMTGLDKESD